MKLAALSIFSIAAVSFSSSCAPQVGAPLEGSIAGTVTKGPVGAAAVTAFATDPDGRRAKELGTTSTEPDGSFVVQVGGHSGPTLVCASGGTFVDEATGVVVGLGTNELCALVDDLELGTNATGLLITPFTSLHAALAGCFLAGGAESTVLEASNRAALRLNDFLAAGTRGFDFRTSVPLDATAALAPSFSAEAWHGVLLAGLSESARQISIESDLDPAVRVTAATLTTELLRDIDDGACVFDGQGPSGQLSQGTVALSANTLRGAPQGLAQSIGAFLDGDRNVSGVSRASVEDLLRSLSTHESEIFAGDAGGDLEPPAITISEPLAGPVAGTPRIVVTATDASPVTELSFTAPEPLVGTGATVCDDATGCTLEGALNTALFPAGDVTITVRTTDAAGNSANASVTVTINNSIPVISVSAPSAGVVSGLVNVQAVASDPDGLASFVIEVPGTVLASQCAPPLLVNDCDQELDPTIIDIQWDTAQANEGPVTITFTATDTAGNPAFAQVAVDVDNVDAGTFAGRVDFGYPLVGSTVTAFEMSDGADGAARGAVIGTALTDDEGLYQIENASFAGTVEVVATGGAFEDPSTGQSLSLRAGQELVAAIADAALGQATVANVNGWSTLAARRAEATQSESASFGAAVTFNSNLFSSHLLRPGSLSLVSSGSADLLVDTPAPSDAAALMALAHAGLSRVAAQLSIDVGGAPGQITPVDLVDVLSLDLRDGVFDGTDTGVALFLDQQGVPADSYVLRTTLAVGIDNYVKNAPFRDGGLVVLEAVRNNSGIDSDALAAPDLLYDDLSLNRSVLFPANDAVIPFDRTPPTVVLTFGVPNEDATQGEALSGVVSILGLAVDTSGLSAFNVLSPGVADLFSPVADVRVDIDGSIAPNEAEVLELCGDAFTGSALTGDGEPPELLAEPERQVCLCVEAVDALENTALSAHCFTRPRPVVVTDATAFVGPDRSSISATATGSFDLEGCAGAVSQDGAVLGAAAATASGNVCSIAVPITSPFGAGSAILDVDVTEIGGAVSRSSFSYTVDLDAPAVLITAPAAGSFRSTPPIITATATDANLVSVTVDVTSNALPVALGLAGTLSPTGAVTFPAFTDAEPDGLRTIVVTATDAAGNTSTDQRSYTKDTAAPALANLGAADGNPLRHFQLTATTAFSASSGCSTFPFSGCVFSIPAAAVSEDVDFRPSASSVETYRRWQHLAGVLVNPSSGANPPVENRVPTLRLKTEANIVVEARVDPTCASTAALFEDRPRGTFMANAVGLADLPIIDALGVTTGSLLRTQLGQETLCLSARPTDQAGNKGAIVTHFFKYEATPAPLFFVFNQGAYTPGSFAEDVEALDDGDDDNVLSGSGQGAAGRVFAHAYLVSPSTSSAYNYVYGINSGAAPRITVSHREVVQVSRRRAFNWCYTQDGNDGDTLVDDEDDDLVNPDQIIANTVNTPPNNPTWSGTNTDTGSSSASWALFTPTGGTLLSASAVMEHRPGVVDGEADTTFSHGPAESYPTNADTTELGQLFTFGIDLTNVTIEAWSFNSVTGLPGTVIDSGATVAFTAGGSSPSTRHRLLVFRAPVPQNSITLKTAQVLNGQLGTLGFNDRCSARNAANDSVNQMFELSNDHWVVVDASLPSGGEPAPPRRLLWVRSGSFSECDATSAHDCRYGRYFDDYVSSSFAFQAGRSLTAEGKIGGLNSAPFKAQASHTIPAGETRALSQEP